MTEGDLIFVFFELIRYHLRIDFPAVQGEYKWSFTVNLIFYLQFEKKIKFLRM